LSRIRPITILLSSLAPAGPLPPLDDLAAGFHLVSDDELTRDPTAALPPIDYAPLRAATRQVSAWLLDLARSRTTDPLDVAAIDRVQRAVAATIDGAAPGARGQVSEEDILTVLGILITAFELDVGQVDLGAVFGALYDAADPLTDHLAQVIGAAMAEHVQGSNRIGRGRARATAPIVVRRAPRLAYAIDDDEDRDAAGFTAEELVALRRALRDVLRTR